VDSLPSIRVFLAERLNDGDESLAAKVLLAVSEAATNIILHGASSPGDSQTEDTCCETLCADEDEDEAQKKEIEYDGQSLRVELIRSRAWTAVRLAYGGVPFPWHLPPPAQDIETMPEGGFGRALMDKSADSVLHASGPEKLQLVCLFFESRDCEGL
jgi:hypothetical protein